MAIPVVEATGTNYEIGYEMGRHAKSSLHKIVVNLARFKQLKNDWGNSRRLNELMAKTKATFPDYYQELQGISDGSEMTLEDIFLWNCRGDFPKGVTENIETAGCTDVLLAKTDNRKAAIIAHNEDGNVKLGGHCFIVKARIKSKESKDKTIVSFAYPGLLMGHTFGVNSKGLVITINHLPWYKKIDGIPRHFIGRALLDCNEMEDAVRLLKSRRSTGSFNYNIGQAGRDYLLSVETPAGKSDVVKVTKQFAHANHYISPSHKSLLPEEKGSTYYRQKRADKLLQQNSLTASHALKVLFDNEDKAFPIFRNATGKDLGVKTLATAFFRINEGSVSWKFYNGNVQRPIYKGRFNVC